MSARKTYERFERYTGCPANGKEISPSRFPGDVFLCEFAVRGSRFDDPTIRNILRTEPSNRAATKENVSRVRDTLWIVSPTKNAEEPDAGENASIVTEDERVFCGRWWSIEDRCSMPKH